VPGLPGGVHLSDGLVVVAHDPVISNPGLFPEGRVAELWVAFAEQLIGDPVALGLSKGAFGSTNDGAGWTRTSDRRIMSPLL
jgi:hypothetical protein